ncbi:MAG: helix-turn-helix domain-containing protein [Oscillospiraceae bacterium]|jgi:HTH-type transcriptional regulator/antitoxin HigA|nr:helix-turn-helix domain-containing protein [Oscillospiraceae bacterium]
MLRSKSTIAVPPGATIREQLENRGISQKEFAIRMGMTEKHISNLINGKVELTPNVALRLETVLGLPASFWNNLEAIYQEKIARVNAELSVEQDEEIAKQFPYSTMAKWKWVSVTRKVEERVINLRKFFEVAELGLLENLKMPGIAYRKCNSSQKSDYALAAWAQEARLEARKIQVEPINIARLEKEIPTIRSMTVKDPTEFCNELRHTLSGCGVAIIFLPHISGSFLHGASFLDDGHIVLGLTVREKYADSFWFSLFHELCHIIKGHIYSPEPTTPEQEAEANAFARDTLISPKAYQSFIAQGRFDEGTIAAFANAVGIDAGIVLGRLQKDNIVPYSYFNHLKKKYKIV